MSLTSFKDLTAWQVAMDLATAVYEWTAQMPREHRFEIASQMNRASISIPSNIAEGYGRRNRGEYVQFLGIARGSAAELETLAILAERVGLGAPQQVHDLLSRVQQLMYKLQCSLK